MKSALSRRFDVSLVDAKAHLGELVERAAAGDSIRIVCRGKPMAQITAIETPRKPINQLVLRTMTDAMPVQRELARTFVQRIRDADRY